MPSWTPMACQNVCRPRNCANSHKIAATAPNDNQKPAANTAEGWIKVTANAARAKT